MPYKNGAKQHWASRILTICLPPPRADNTFLVSPTIRPRTIIDLLSWIANGRHTPHEDPQSHVCIMYTSHKFHVDGLWAQFLSADRRRVGDEPRENDSIHAALDVWVSLVCIEPGEHTAHGQKWRSRSEVAIECRLKRKGKPKQKQLKINNKYMFWCSQHAPHMCWPRWWGTCYLPTLYLSLRVVIRFCIHSPIDCMLDAATDEKRKRRGRGRNINYIIYQHFVWMANGLELANAECDWICRTAHFR